MDATLQGRKLPWVFEPVASLAFRSLLLLRRRRFSAALFLYKSLHQAYEQLGPATPTQKALAELAAKFIGFEKKEMNDDCIMKADGSSISVNDIVLLAHTSRVT